MCTLVSGFHFQKSPSSLRLSTQMIYVRSNMIMVIVFYRRQQFLEFPTALGITGTMQLLLSPTSLLPSFVVRLDGYCSKISFYTRMCTVMQLNTRALCLLPPLVALFLHGVVVSVRLSSTVIIIIYPHACGLASFPLLINLLLVFPRSCEHSTTYT